MITLPTEDHSFAQFEKLVTYTENLPYRKRREFLRQLKPKLPRFLYKFRALDSSKEDSIKKIRDILVHSQLRLSSPKDLNDPFDMSWNLIATGTLKEKQRRIDELPKSQGVKWTEREKVRPRLMAKTAEIIAGTQSGFGHDIESLGVCSFSRDPGNNVMWSQYSSRHEGFCLQFEVAKDPRTFLKAVPVEYSDEFPVVNWITDFERGIEAVMIRKKSDWRYEKEHRILELNGAGTYLNFRPEALRGLVVGCRITDTTIKKLRELIEERFFTGFSRPTIYRAVKARNGYRLVIKSATLAA